MHAGHHIFHRVAFHLLPTRGGDGVPCAGEEQFQVIVDLRARAHRAARIARHHLLFDGDGRADADDAVDVGLLQPAHELACVAAQAFHVAALAFSVQGIEGQAAFSAPAQPGDHHQLAARDIHAHVLQVVYARTLHPDETPVEAFPAIPSTVGGGRNGFGGGRGRQRRREIRYRQAPDGPQTTIFG